jgi:hypothetical protein
MLFVVMSDSCYRFPVNYLCRVCSREIYQDDYDSYDCMCWDDQLTEESDSMFDEMMQG